MATKPVCSDCACDKPAFRTGLCSLHYKRARAKNPLRICSIPGCGSIHDSKGYCALHYKSWRRYGDPLKSQEVKQPKICSIPNCGKPHYGHGLCAMHNYRRKKRGSPTSGRTFNGLAEKFFEEVVLNCYSDECLIWPYSRNPKGYAVMARHGQKRTMLVHRRACEARHGPPPDRKQQAAHSCGRGRDACVNPCHVRWDDQKGNESDKLEHGTRIRGEEANSKLSETQVREIRAAKGRITQVELAKLFGVRTETISNVQRRKTWAWLD